MEMGLVSVKLGWAGVESVESDWTVFRCVGWSGLGLCVI